MKKRIGLVWALALAGLAVVFNASSAEPQASPWVSLFNGKDLTGWAPVNDVTFEVQDGNLRLVKGMGWLRTDKEYRDFILELEWRALVEKYDSGIFVRVGLEGKPWPTTGWQVNLRYDGLGGLVRGTRSVVPAETPKLPVNQWVKFRLEVKGRKISLKVNGELAWEEEVLDRDQGYIGIQAENFAFDFRHVRIQELATPAK
jgi:hypothetical protein